eukprot:CAMPEP_0202909610 /NCGR_PEP_ID=MMETSP1392-20130828/49772_1 /ASSEMBLY_ACC=CAM_ASM_000868 /TAXON_ID=225041 /ORGANISM="Chlamydomonas chlamydogama, Strain SAG 11-48b" /LENGTH=44 /DNA_ID= /DNA_START= /DNA_END= /DNA_ORIENTATION=
MRSGTLVGCGGATTSTSSSKPSVGYLTLKATAGGALPGGLPVVL